jgi:hypothetical protein
MRNYIKMMLCGAQSQAHVAVFFYFAAKDADDALIRLARLNEADAGFNFVIYWTLDLYLEMNKEKIIDMMNSGGLTEESITPIGQGTGNGCATLLQQLGYSSTDARIASLREIFVQESPRKKGRHG